MPTIPRVDPVVPSQSGGSYQRATPQLVGTPQVGTVRANPGMYDGVNAANQRLAGAVANVLTPTMELQMQVKAASDAGTITRAQTQLEAAQLDFANWAKTNPDPDTWGPELSARMSETKSQVMESAKTLSPVAQERLGLLVNDWEVGTAKRVQLQATEQRIQVAAAAFTDYIQIATANNDLAAVELKAAEGVQAGIFNPKTAQSMVARSRQTIQMNVVNGLIEQDPFEAERRLAEKGEDGRHTLLPDMSATARQTLEFRANRAAAQQRTNMVKEWAHMIRDAQDGKGPMPDKDGVMEEAKRIGVTPKQVDAMFKVPTATDPEDFALVYSMISTYDPDQDPTGQRMGELVQGIEMFKGPALTRLNALLERKAKPDDALNSPVAKFGEAQITNFFNIGGYGSFKRPMAGGLFQDDPALKQKAALIRAENLVAFHEWVKKNPGANQLDAQKFIASLNTNSATNTGAKLINGAAFQLPKLKK